MPHQPTPLLLSTFALAAALLAAPARADVLVDTWGGNNALPFNIAEFGIQNVRYHQVYDASVLSGLAGQTITGLRFATSEHFSHSFDSVLSDVRISLSTTSYGPWNLRATFAKNVGADATVVFSGPLALSSAGTGAFDIYIPFSQGFNYDPTQGNLLLDVSNFGGGLTTQFRYGFSAVMSRTYSFGTAGVNDAMGQPHYGVGLATQFVTTPAVPEPQTYALMAAGLALVGFAAGRRRRG